MLKFRSPIVRIETTRHEMVRQSQIQPFVAFYFQSLLIKYSVLRYIAGFKIFNIQKIGG